MKDPDEVPHGLDELLAWLEETPECDLASGDLHRSIEWHLNAIISKAARSSYLPLPPNIPVKISPRYLPGIDGAIQILKRLRQFKNESATTPEAKSGEQPRDSDAFVPVGKLWPQHFDNYGKAKRFLKNHPEIRTRKPTKYVLEVNGLDWVRHFAEKPEITDKDIDDYMEGVDDRHREVRQKKKEEGPELP